MKQVQINNYNINKEINNQVRLVKQEKSSQARIALAYKNNDLLLNNKSCSLKKIHILLFYKFQKIKNPEWFARKQKSFCKKIGILGKILIAKEGINGSISGTKEQIEKYKKFLWSFKGFEDVIFKEENAFEHPFTKMAVRIRNEIVSLKKLVDINKKGKYLTPKEFLGLYNNDNRIISNIGKEEGQASEVNQTPEALTYNNKLLKIKNTNKNNNKNIGIDNISNKKYNKVREVQQEIEVKSLKNNRFLNNENKIINNKFNGVEGVNQIRENKKSNNDKLLKINKTNNLINESNDFIVLDARNYYEYELGRFKNALNPNIKTFREFPKFVEKFKKRFSRKERENKKIVMYCTGGIRCEKASAYMKKCGFKNIYQLEGGVINFCQQFPNTVWEGKCFVFDKRLMSDLNQNNKPITKCINCNELCDLYRNCKNLECDKLVIMCVRCQEKLQGCCSKHCMDEFLRYAKERAVLKKSGEWMIKEKLQSYVR